LESDIVENTSVLKSLVLLIEREIGDEAIYDIGASRCHAWMFSSGPSCPERARVPPNRLPPFLFRNRFLIVLVKVFELPTTEWEAAKTYYDIASPSQKFWGVLPPTARV
jgi:hypothetical protein